MMRKLAKVVACLKRLQCSSSKADILEAAGDLLDLDVSANLWRRFWTVADPAKNECFRTVLEHLMASEPDKAFDSLGLAVAHARASTN